MFESLFYCIYSFCFLLLSLFIYYLLSNKLIEVFKLLFPFPKYLPIWDNEANDDVVSTD